LVEENGVVKHSENGHPLSIHLFTEILKKKTTFVLFRVFYDKTSRIGSIHKTPLCDFVVQKKSTTMNLGR